VSNKKEFFDMSKIKELDRQITEQLAQPTLVDQMQDQNARKESMKDTWQAEWRRYWFIYVILGISGIFTATLGIYMGLSPTLVTGTDGSQFIHFNTDVGHILLAIVYLIAFVGNTEYMFAVAKQKYHTREEFNNTQRYTMLIAMIVAGVSMVFTGIAGGMVIASNISFLSEFVNIPPAAQKWVVVSIPILLAIYTALFSAYALSSEEAKTERLTKEQERKQVLDHQTRMKQVELIGARNLQLAEIERYMELVGDGLISAADAQAAIRAGRTLKQEEVRQGKDIDQDNKIGDQPELVRGNNGRNP